MKKRKIISWILVLGIMIMIFCFSNQESYTTSLTSSSITGKIFDFLNLDGILVFDSFHGLIRKFAHFIIYFILGFYLSNALFVSTKKDYIIVLVLAVLIAMIYAGSDEVHQLFVAGRNGSIMDVLLDTIGASIGALIYYFGAKLGGIKRDL